MPRPCPRDDAMSAGHDCSTPVSGAAVMEDAATTSTSTASSMSAMSLQKKVDGGRSSGFDASLHRARYEPPFPVPNALEAMAAGMQGGVRRWEGFWGGKRVHFGTVGFFCFFFHFFSTRRQRRKRSRAYRPIMIAKDFPLSTSPMSDGCSSAAGGV